MAHAQAATQRTDQPSRAGRAAARDLRSAGPAGSGGTGGTGGTGGPTRLSDKPIPAPSCLAATSAKSAYPADTRTVTGAGTVAPATADDPITANLAVAAGSVSSAVTRARTHRAGTGRSMDPSPVPGRTRFPRVRR